MVNYLTITFK